MSAAKPLSAQDAALLRDALDAMRSEAPPGWTPPPRIPVSEATIRAAIADTFLPDEIGLDPDASAAILASSEQIMIAGHRRLRLTDAARAGIIGAARPDPAFHRILREAGDQDCAAFDAISRDEVRLPTAWLRCFLLVKFGQLSRAPASELRAAVSALERLRLVDTDPLVPTVRDARRQLELAELLEPLRILIGARGGWEGRPATDRFVGRDTELRQLRGFVDELESHSLFELAARASKRVFRSDAEGRVITARGGLGKTALIAKFVLDHALRQGTPLPFAYLDFDRAALNPRDPRRLLLEVIRQVSLQFPDAAAKLDGLAQLLRAELSDPTVTGLADPFGEFRAIVQADITRRERAFLLVFDTMEVVQYDAASLHGVVRLVERLQEDRFPELRVVAAGRADIPELRSPSLRSLIELPPLSVPDATDMAQALGRDLVGSTWRPQWARRIAGREREQVVRREPLSIRVAVELLRAASQESVGKAEALSRAIDSAGEAAGAEFVAVLYRARILEHIRDRNVRRLAWPGLVVRRVTSAIVRDLLAEPCGLTPEQAEAAFIELTKEVWLVERDGDGWRHRADLRSRTLPLMRRLADPERNLPEGALFRIVNGAAIAYFGARSESSPADRAEWLYHRLLAGESPEELEPDWTDDVATRLHGAESDLEPDSEAAIFVAARSATRLLPFEQVQRMRPALALELVCRTSPDLGDFDDAGLNPLLLWLNLERALTGKVSASARVAAETLAVKTGRWALLEKSSSVVDEGAWQEQSLFARHYLRARTPQYAERVWWTTSRFPSAQNELHCIAQDLAATRVWGLAFADYGSLDINLTELLSAGIVRTTAREGPALRLIIAFGDRSARPAFAHWLRLVDWQERIPDSATLSLQELHELVQAYPSVATAANRLRLEARAQPHTRLDDGRSASRLAGKPTIAFLRTLARHAAKTEPDWHALRRFALSRDEDWLIPIAYAASRLVDSSGPEPATSSQAASRFQSRGLLQRLLRPADASETDTLRLLRAADEASCLIETAREMLAMVPFRKPGSDLAHLLDLHERWRWRVTDLLDPRRA